MSSAASVGMPVDDRGLLPLTQARAIVSQAQVFDKGEGRDINGTWVLESDLLWAALMSLEDADEFIREASRLQWRFHPRRGFSREPAQRFGEAIRPWLASFVQDGVLINLPWSVLDCLYELGDLEAFEVLSRVDHVLSFESAPGEPGPFAHGVPRKPYDPIAARAAYIPGETTSQEALLALKGFCDENPYGWGYLAGVVADSEAELQRRVNAFRVLTVGVKENASDVFANVVECYEDEAWARNFFEVNELPTELLPESVLEHLDAACADDEAWPLFYGQEPDRAYHALRLLACRSKEGDRWFVVFDCLEGSSEERLYIRRYITKSDGSFGMLQRVSFPRLSLIERSATQATFRGPRGTVVIDAAVAASLSPLRATAAEVVDMVYTLGVRGYLRAYGWPFLTLEETFEALGFETEEWDVIVDSTAFEHVIGTAGVEYDPDGLDVQWRLLPSQSPVYASLARAIASRRADSFAPGTSNLDWQLHLDGEKPSRVSLGRP